MTYWLEIKDPLLNLPRLVSASRKPSILGRYFFLTFKGCWPISGYVSSLVEVGHPGCSRRLAPRKPSTPEKKAAPPQTRPIPSWHLQKKRWQRWRMLSMWRMLRCGDWWWKPVDMVKFIPLFTFIYKGFIHVRSGGCLGFLNHQYVSDMTGLGHSGNATSCQWFGS